MNPVAADAKSSFFRRSWNGSARLREVYWGLGFIGLIAVALLVAVINALLRGPLAVPLADEFCAAVLFAYLLFLSISTWRCAYNVRVSAIGTLARIAAVIPWLSLALIVISAAR
ncbi:hypothetical protein ACFQZQ_04830 [Lysobacter koreensis]|uniref:DUF805 domain-containing protein n=1 Tax=Lysobacter koreensis TaxID=266122 RepID=A0ABW2YLS8_9GAMM